MPFQHEDDIPAALAASLKDMGLSWRAVGRLIARQRGRSLPYQGDSVRRAVRAAKKLEISSNGY